MDTRSRVLLRVHAGDVLAGKLDGAALDAHQTADGAQRRGLARAVGADEGDDLALLDGEGDALEGLDAAVADFQIRYFQQAHSSSTPQICLYDLGIILHFGGRALRDEFAKVDHVDAVGDVHDQVHVVLNHEHGELEVLLDLADESAQFVRLLRVHARGRLVEQKQRRLRGQRAGRSPAAAVCRRAGGGHLAGHVGKADDFEKFHGFLAHRALSRGRLSGRWP